MQRSPLIFSGLLILSGAFPAAHAAELGDAAVRSWLGQPMIVDIELLPDEGGQVQASLAHPDVFRGANVAMPAVLAAARLSVMRRDGRQFLHVVSARPVETAPVHLFLELVENGKHSVREVTLWFKPEPHPPAAVAEALPAAAAAAGAVASSRPMPQPAAAANSPRGGGADAAAVHGGAHDAPAAAAAAVAAGGTAAPRRAVSRAPAAESAAAARACAGLDYKNAQLSAQIVDLEEKVKLLQAAIDAQAPPLPQPVPAVHGAGHVSPKAAAKRGQPADSKGAKDGKDAKPKTSWLLYGGLGAAAALVAAAAAIILRKRKGKAVSKAARSAATGKGGLGALIAKMKRQKPAPPPAEEPALEPDTAQT